MLSIIACAAHNAHGIEDIKSRAMTNEYEPRWSSDDEEKYVQLRAIGKVQLESKEGKPRFNGRGR